MKQHLSVSAVPPPPVVTVIVPRTFTAAYASVWPPRNRRTSAVLFPPYIVYPLPPASPEFVTRERPKLVSITTARTIQRRHALSVLRAPRVVNTPAAAVVYERLKIVSVTAAQAIQRRHALSVLRPPRVVNVVVAVVYPPVTVHLVRARRPRTMAGIRAPMFISPGILFRPVATHLVRSHTLSRKARSTYVFPIVVHRLNAFGWVAISLARTPRPPLLSSFLRPPQ